MWLFNLCLFALFIQFVQHSFTPFFVSSLILFYSLVPREVLSGVPQGSVLGPLLFLIYINSIGCHLNSSYKIFADDLKIYTCAKQSSVGEPPLVTVANVQQDIDLLSSTAASWGLNMNRDKCAVLRFSRPLRNVSRARYLLNGHPISQTNSHSDLGVTVDTDLKFHAHVRSVARKAGGLAQNFLRSTVCRSPEFMLFLFSCHIRPIIEYCSCLWNVGYIEDIRLLENVQRRWTKQIDGLGGLAYHDRLNALKLFSIQGRLLRADLIQCWKIFHGKSCLPPESLFCLSQHNRTRGHSLKVIAPTVVTDVRKRFFSVRCVSTWNSLPPEAVCVPDLKGFKGFLEKHITDRLYSFV